MCPSALSYSGLFNKRGMALFLAMDCIFCKIINKEVKSQIVEENDKVVAFYDISPKADVHILVAPKKHIASVKELSQQDKMIVAEMILTAREIAAKKGLNGYKLVINVGREGGQTVEHLHLHLLGGKNIVMP